MKAVAERRAEAPYRATPFGPRSIKFEKRADGSILMQSQIPLAPYERSICDCLVKWSREAPDRIWLAQRRGPDAWETLTYRDGWTRVRAIGQSLLDLDPPPASRIAVLSGNSIEHALIMMAGMAVGMVIAPISPMYSLLPTGLGRLAEIARVLHPDVVFVQRVAPFAAARGIAELARAKWISVEPHDSATQLAKLEASIPGPAFIDACDAVEPDMIAKILFTSGSTGSPKGVINTHRMLCCSVAMGPSVLPLSDSDEPTVQVEWLPWHHTMGGNAIFNNILSNGGTLYIDPGRPTPDAFHLTIAALREISPTSMLNVPAGLSLLVDALQEDPLLRRSVFKRLRRVSAGGAATPPAVVEHFQKLAVETVGERIPFVSAYGTTETAPGISMTYWASEQAAELGLPMPGVELKLVPYEDRYELRVRGPNVMPGYLDRPDLTAAAFDSEGYYCLGDAVTFIDPDDASRGLRFAGRLSENFKLTNGTWVIAGDLRLAILDITMPVLQDIVIAGENRDAVTVLAWVSKDGAKAHVGDPDVLASADRLVSDPALLAYISRALERHNANARSSSQIAAFRLLIDPPSLGAGEITDKGSINQRAVLANRAPLVEELYRIPAPAGVIRL